MFEKKLEKVYNVFVLKYKDGFVNYGIAIKLPKSNRFTYDIDTEKFFQERNKPIPEKFIIERTSEELGIITDPAIANEVVKGWSVIR